MILDYQQYCGDNWLRLANKELLTIQVCSVLKYGTMIKLQLLRLVHTIECIDFR